MSLARLLRPTNGRVRIMVGLLLAAAFAIQCTHTEAFRESAGVQVISGQPIGKNPAELSAKLENWAKTDHIALLKYCQANVGQYKDYTVTFIKQEVIDGATKSEQEMQIKHRDNPFSVVMTWTRNALLGDRVIYVEGKYDNNMLVRPSIMPKLIGTQVRKPDSEEVMKNTLRPVNLFGFRRGLQSLVEVYEQAQKAGELKMEFGKYGKVFGRDAIILVRWLPNKPEYPAVKTVVYIDLEYLVPIRIEGYDVDGRPTSLYTYKDIKMNVGLTDEDFRPENNDMKTPK